MKIVSRAEARALGLKRYFTGEPCKYGHIAERNTKKSTCLACKAEAGRIETAANPEALKAYRHAYYLANIERHRERCKAYAEAHREELKQYHAEYYAANRERLRALNLARYYKDHEKWRAYHAARYASNPEKFRSAVRLRYEADPSRVRRCVKEWRKKYPDRYRVQVQTRRARKSDAGGKLSPDIVQRLLALQRGRCACCGKRLGKKFHLDHIVSLARGGSNTDDNVQLLTPRCNNQKHAKDPIDFMQSRGKLL